ncbi:zinc finger protein 830-like [Selaginella moellendorffii]|uniref:zinc finger protein 830-like n=1 Tax=Selaginella moellendorffii TaxID=88036 RepID=UPI000D1CDBE5|nr:zinc finger protein 830-like [Selaginella moellendorffii]|eukprot:XP_024527944.1 zinc finger protein 830-like [Selaginella moellendorffii]
MDATRKAMFRSRLRQAEERKEKIDSPLARYNDLGQLVCKVCNISIKTEALWGAHLASQQHKEAADELKERAKRLKAAAATAEPTRSTSVAQKAEQNGNKSEAVKGDSQRADSNRKPSNGEAPPAQSKDTTGPLPEGFFDNAAADMKARGVEAPKINMQEELDHFHKLIEEDVKAVDDRHREEEVEAAEIRHEEEEIEQSVCMERVEMLKKRKLELRDETKSGGSKPKKPENLLDELSSDDESDEDTVLDWRGRR